MVDWSASFVPRVLAIRASAARTVCAGLLLVGVSGCAQLGVEVGGSSDSTPASSQADPFTSSDAGASVPLASDATPATPEDKASEAASEATPVQPDPYETALKRASLAIALSESAQSKDDWTLVVGRWQQAIDLLNAVPDTSPNRPEVAAKLADYRRRQASARVLSSQPVPVNTQTERVAVGDEPDGGAPGLAPDSAGETVAAAEDTNGTSAASETEAGEGQVYRAPIVRRSGGTPVIQVMFNGTYAAEMIVDTGASGTVITREVAQALDIQATGKTNVSTASARNVTFLLGQMDSITVEGAQLTDVVVAIAGPNLDTGLLGNDFFGRYDVTVRADEVEFRSR